MRALLCAVLMAAFFMVPSAGTVVAQGIGTAAYDIRYGQDYLEAKQYELAAMRFRQAIGLDANNAEAHFLLGKAYMALQRRDEAIAEINQSYRLNPALKAREGEIRAVMTPAMGAGPPTKWTGLNGQAPNAGIGSAARELNYGKGYLASGGDPSLAAMRLRQAIAIDPRLAEAHFWLAAAYQAEGRQVEADQALSTAYVLDPTLKGHEAELARFKPPAPKPAAPGRLQSPVPEDSESGSCDDLYSACYVTATRCGMNGCTTDYARQGQCQSERNACEARNRKR